MGVALKDLIQAKDIDFDDLNHKILAVDSFNILYQFLTTIRMADGTLLQDSKGNITSHLNGLFHRTANLLKKGIKLIFVFDGKPPELKFQENQRRSELKKEAQKKYEEAAKKEDIEEMKKYASRTSRLTPEMVEEAKKLVLAFGLPVIQAPSEGEAQAAFIVKQGDAYATASQDYDSLLHGSLKLVRNLSITGKKKKTNKLSYETVKLELVTLADTLNQLGIDNNQLIVLAMMVGTDYNPGGIKGIGPKNALKLVREHKQDFDGLFKKVEWGNFYDIPWTDIYYTIKNIPIDKKYKISWGKLDADKIIKLLVEEHDFSEERVTNVLGPLVKKEGDRKQTGLGKFF